VVSEGQRSAGAVASAFIAESCNGTSLWTLNLGGAGNGGGGSIISQSRGTDFDDAGHSRDALHCHGSGSAGYDGGDYLIRPVGRDHKSAGVGYSERDGSRSWGDAEGTGRSEDYLSVQEVHRVRACWGDHDREQNAAGVGDGCSPAGSYRDCEQHKAESMEERIAAKHYFDLSAEHSLILPDA
jgi:hypothetical protein